MPSLKDLKNRISSVKSTQKITSAMKMVAAAKLRRAQDQALASRPYTSLMDKIVSKISSKATGTSIDLLTGKPVNKTQLLVVFSADFLPTIKSLTFTPFCCRSLISFFTLLVIDPLKPPHRPLSAENTTNN